ncbi:MAG: CIA30 family protein [Cyanobacteria bacterium P01_A01_bin.17]
MSEQARQPWNVGRFMQTLTYFEALPVISWFQKMLPAFTPPAPPQLQAGMIFDFRQPIADLDQTWGVLDDVVMGGASSSSFQAKDGAALFSGIVTTANSGGFASVRTRNFEPPLDLNNHSGIELQVKGDGQRYKFLMRDEDSWDSVAYAYSFDTEADQWQTVQIPFTEMTAVFRAKTVPDASSINQGQVRSLQLMLSKFEYDGDLNPSFQPGEFKLCVQSIGVY